jgi:hypothetical protein
MGKQLWIVLAVIASGVLIVKISLDRGSCGIKKEFQGSLDAIEQAKKTMGINSEPVNSRSLWEQLVCLGVR